MGHLLLNFSSKTLRQTTQVQVILPEASNDVTPLYPEDDIILIYLLHGLTGNASEWTRFSKIEYYAKKYNAIIVLPEVHRSFYLDQPGAQYEQYVSTDLPKFLERWFKIPAKEKTFLSGESMGGYGTLRIGLTHSKNYEKIAALSPVISLKKLITSEPDLFAPDEWASSQLERVREPLDLLMEGKAEVYRDGKLLLLCGTEDEFYEDTREFENKCKQHGYNVASHYETGEHSWLYWDHAIHRAIRFFRDLDDYLQ
ncbi:alpha/beta hydrolase-fold protein [Neobacillus sp. OS1-32]|jgi:putative tributyrin esterase|uniref:alpha/beta hydrolase n=1 Tax=Neobacillus sp. OS1-32 TaxID=3070682 RepID=UPI0027E02A22|nr:alpha/beta hydrolase-fold protein [Neobacillus sp. OS1-32]WML32202.1 alpha/beta hydrolase-fold protein [Neobacillus sp. OS1-32]